MMKCNPRVPNGNLQLLTAHMRTSWLWRVAELVAIHRREVRA